MVGEDYYGLLINLPFNQNFENVNKIIYRFSKSKSNGGKIYIAKIFRSIENWC